MLYWEQDGNKIYQGHILDVLRTGALPDESVHMIVTSPPYWGLRNYDLPPTIWDDPGDCQHVWGDEKIKDRHNKLWATNSKPENCYDNTAPESQGQFCQLCGAWRACLGLEPTPELFIQHIVKIFWELRRVLRSDGTLWLNMGDSYAGGGRGFGNGGLQDNNKGCENMPRSTIPKNLKPKDLCGIPWRVALALQADGWYLRSAMPWVKRTSMPESCKDRPTSALDYVFLLTKSQHYFYDKEAKKKQASPDSHRRYARGRGNDHKWSDGGPGNQSIAKSFKHMIPGVNPKSAPAGSLIKANESFHSRINDLVGSRNFRNTDLFFESIEPPFGAIFAGDELVGLDILSKGFSGAHFATFPPRIPEVAILAGTSEKGCCVECGAPWERITEKAAGSTDKSTINWKPGCKCRAGKIPCTVLDPFAGAMTTAIVANRYARKYIMIDLSKIYIDQIGIPRIEKHTRQLRLWD